MPKRPYAEMTGAKIDESRLSQYYFLSFIFSFLEVLRAAATLSQNNFLSFSVLFLYRFRGHSFSRGSTEDCERYRE